MKIDLAVYTAQEGYSWQPGTRIPVQDLNDFKYSIGRFPSLDGGDVPFGGVFLKDDKVVFYRYHVARKIDFRGRDALYCVLGVIPKDEAAAVDVKALFSLPEFSGVVKPFPTQAEVAPASSGRVPEWLRNLDAMSLDVRISGSLDDMKCTVRQEPKSPPAPVRDVVPSSEAVASPVVRQKERRLRPGWGKALLFALFAFLLTLVSLLAMCLYLFRLPKSSAWCPSPVPPWGKEASRHGGEQVFPAAVEADGGRCGDNGSVEMRACEGKWGTNEVNRRGVLEIFRGDDVR